MLPGDRNCQTDVSTVTWTAGAIGAMWAVMDLSQWTLDYYPYVIHI